MNWKDREKDLDSELRAHLEMAAGDARARGESADAARLAALREFGNRDLVKETTRDIWGRNPFHGIVDDLRAGLRTFRKNPAFAAIMVFTLALGIGANTAIFSLLDQALLRTLPVKDTDRLVVLQSVGSFNGNTSSRTDENFYFSYPMYRDLRDRNSVFSGLIATVWTQVGVQWRNQPELVAAELVSGNYFEVLAVQPARGRLLVASDDLAPDANPIVVLSFSYWKRRFGSDPNVVNQSILVNGHPFTILGVAPPGFHSVVMGDTPDLFAPMTMKAEVKPGFKDLEDRKSRWLNIVGKLKPGLSRDQAEVGAVIHD